MHTFYKKPPRPDSIDFRILTLTQKILPKVQGQPVYLLMQEKSASKSKLHRPICLLQTLSKLLQKILIFHLIIYPHTNIFTSWKVMNLSEYSLCAFDDNFCCIFSDGRHRQPEEIFESDLLISSSVYFCSV